MQFHFRFGTGLGGQPFDIVRRASSRRARLASLALPLGLAACTSSDEAALDDTPAYPGSAPSDVASEIAPATPGTAATGAEPVYALMTQVYDQEDRTVYIALSHTLDLDSVDLSTAREFPGVANLAAVGGRLLVSSGQSPTITEFDITQDLEWHEGRTVNFGQYPLEDNANFYAQFIVDEHTAYLPYEAFKRIIWDPSEMAIRGEMTDTSIVPEQGNLRLEAGGNRNSVHYEGPVRQAFFYHDEDWFRYGDESLIATYDPSTHREAGVLRVPCAGLSIATTDEQGYTYFGPWSFLGTLALFGEGPAPCVARLRPDLTLDEGWTTDLTDLTGGRYINNFRYIGTGRAVANVLHHELIDGDFSGGYDPDVADRIDASGPHWRFWQFDLRQGTAAPIDGIDVELSSGAQFAVLDGRTFIFLPFDDWGKSMVYELDDAAHATARFQVDGDLFKWIRVR